MPSAHTRAVREVVLRILMSCERFVPIVGGLERQALQLARTLRSRGHDVRVVTRRFAGLAAEDEADGVPIRRLGGLHTMGPGRAGFVAGQVSWAFTVARHLRRAASTFDLLHVHGLGPHGGFVARVARRLGRPSIVKIATAGVGEAGLAGRRLAALRKQAMRGFDRYVAISGEIAAALHADGISEAQIVRIPNAVDVDRFRPRDSAARLRTRQRLLREADGVSVILAMSRLERRKGLHTIVQAVATLPRTDVLLVVAGDGPERARLERQAAALGAGTRVRFVGTVEDPAAWLEAADLFALPSEREGMPNSLLEALASGTSVVASRIPGVTDAASDAEAWLVRPGDVDAWRDVIAHALDDDAARRAKAAAGRARVESTFALDPIVRAYEALYHTLLGPSSDVQDADR